MSAEPCAPRQKLFARCGGRLQPSDKTGGGFGITQPVCGYYSIFLQKRAIVCAAGAAPDAPQKVPLFRNLRPDVKSHQFPCAAAKNPVELFLAIAFLRW